MTHVAIIGAGPAGLATAAELAERDIAFTVLERGDRPFAALHELDPEMQLLTPGRFSRLPGMHGWASEPAYAKFGEVVHHFEAWCAARGLAITERATVERVERKPDGFVVRYHRDGAAHELAASHVVSATGIIAHPVIPADFQRAGYTRPWQHSLTVRSSDLAAAHSLAIVGAGMSAAEVLERWLEVKAPSAHAWWSTRRPVRAAPQKILGVDIHYLLWAPELAPARLLGKRIGPERDLIIGRTVLTALKHGAVSQVPEIVRYERDTVMLHGGKRLTPDLLVLATGYRYAAEHLAGLVELDDRGHPIVDRHSASTRAPNLYILGLRFGRSVASSALRGIVRDAAHVAKRIAT